MAFHPYLYFDGTCREAFTRYQAIFGGELVLLTGDDAPPDAGVPDGKTDLVMHAALKIDDDLLMASDSYDDFAPVHGMYVHYSTTDVDRAREVFAALSEGGTVEMAGDEVFWSPFFGVCVDRFGTPWQVSAEATDQG